MIIMSNEKAKANGFAPVRRNAITSFIVDGRDYFAAYLDNGGVRVGLIGGVSFDFPQSHMSYMAIALIENENEAEEFHDLCCSQYL
jgi:hypothetical protein